MPVLIDVGGRTPLGIFSIYWGTKRDIGGRCTNYNYGQYRYKF